MATILENQASISYLYQGTGVSQGATSNVASTVLTDACSVIITKTPLSETFRNGDRVSYIIRIENTGSAGLSGVTVTDNLGDALSYVGTSLNVYVQGEAVTVTPTPGADTLSFTLPVTLAPGEVVIAAYTAAVNTTADTITNTVTVTGTGLNPGACQLSEQATATITAEAFAELSIYKASDAATVISGDTLTYTFTILNSGNSPATDVVLTDSLPSAFTADTVSVSTEGTTTVYTPDQYTIDPTTNTITLPNATGPEITVPAATAAGPGTTTVTITGRII